MKAWLYGIGAAVALGAAIAQGQMLGAGSGTMRIVSTNVQEKAWRRDVVMSDGAGNLKGGGGAVESKVRTDAIDAAAENAEMVSIVADTTMQNCMDYVYSKTNNVAQYCVMTALHVAPETVRSNITGYVVQTTTTTNNWDYQYVWYDRAMNLRPVRYVEYSYYAATNSVKCEWLNWTTNGVAVTVNGRTWNGCHLCKVQRPSWAQGEVCLDFPNEHWGSADGIDWGDMNLMMDGQSLYTGFVTNGITGDVLYFDNGFLTTNPEGGE